MGDLRNKARKMADQQAIHDRERMRREGWTIFHFDFNPKLTRMNLSPGDALRHLLKVTNHKISWWRCPVRGWAIQYTKLPATTKAYDYGETYRVMHFSRLEDELEAKKELCEDMLLSGIELYRGLPNKVFREQVELIQWLLTAPPSVSAEDWLKRKEELPKRVQDVLRTHEPDLRVHLLGQKPDSLGRHIRTVEERLEAVERSR